MTMEISGHALVIGASGIGRACALAFARYDARSVFLADLNLEMAEATITECKAVASNAEFQARAVWIDITKKESVKEAMSLVMQELGRIDYCVNSAGVGVQIASEISESDIAEFKNMLDVNVTGTFLVTRTISSIMKSQAPLPINPSAPQRGTTRGAIVNLGSASSFVATPKMVQYTAAKHAVFMEPDDKMKALDNAPYGIRVNSVCPSWVDTPMIRNAMEKVPGLGDMIKSAVPLGRIASAEEVADAVVFLCGPMSSYTTGCNMILDGGATLTSLLS